jgi:hypothetical protein
MYELPRKLSLLVMYFQSLIFFFVVVFSILNHLMHIHERSVGIFLLEIVCFTFYFCGENVFFLMTEFSTAYFYVPGILIVHFFSIRKV